MGLTLYLICFRRDKSFFFSHTTVNCGLEENWICLLTRLANIFIKLTKNTFREWKKHHLHYFSNYELKKLWIIGLKSKEHHVHTVHGQDMCKMV